MIKAPIKTTISGTGWTLINTADGLNYGYSVYVVDDTLQLLPWYLSTTTSSGSEVPIPAVAISYDNVVGQSEALFYAKTTTGEQTLVLIPGNKSQL